MKIKIIIEETPSWVAPETYVWVSGEIDGSQTRKLLEDLEAFVLRSLNEMGVLKVAGG